MSELRQFTKQPLNYPELITKLKNKGLVINAEPAAINQLQRISYYRFVGYGLAFEIYNADGSRAGKYENGTSFDDVITLYNNDSLIRQHLLVALSKIEIGTRNLISHTMCLNHNNAHWFMDKCNFKEAKQFSHKKLLQQISATSSKSAEDGSEKQKHREQFIHHYYSNYDEPSYPPAWMIAEILSLGSWSLIYGHLSISKDRKSISKQLDLAPPTLESWLHSLTYLRNLCAHHGRLAKRHLPLQPKADKNLPFENQSSLYNYICVVWYLLKKIEPDGTWLDDLFDIVETINNKSTIYGFSENWLEHPHWL